MDSRLAPHPAPRAPWTRGLGCLLALLAPLVAAGPAWADVVGEAGITFRATSTLHDFEGSAAPVPLRLDQGPSGGWSADVSVPVAAIDTGIERRNAGMREMLDATHHPLIRGRFREVDPERIRQSGRLPFVLAIRDRELPVEARVSHWKEDGSRASFDAEFDVSLQEFDLQAPRVLFVRVGDVVRVTVHVTLERA